jgi:purine-nucleoside phosphorylase
MEAAALYMNAARSGNQALCICTISDSLVTGEATTAEVRQNSFTNMMEIAFNII